MTRFARLLLPALMLLFAGLACDSKQTESTPATERSDPSSKHAPDEAPRRIVSLAPSVTETLYALGAGERVVGVTRFCDYPPEAADKPKVGGLTDTDVETIVGLKPDLVVGAASQTAKPLERTLRAAHVPVLFLPVETFDDVRDGIVTLGERVGEPARAAELAAKITAIERTPDDDAPSVMVLFGRSPWIAAGPDTFADEMIRRAGGTNALADADKPYVTLDVERLEATDADLILDTSTGGTDDATEPPIPGARVIRIDPALMRPGPRLAEAMKQFVEAIDEEQR